MADETNGKQQAAPYLPFKTFLSALDALSHGVPPLIDRSIWKTQPGGIQGLIMGALRFFNLIDENNVPIPALEMLATSKPDRPAVLKTLLEQSYPSVFEHDITKMTTKMLEEEIEHYGVTGETKKKAITFFLQAAKFADVSLSPYLQSQIRATPGTRRRRNNSRTKELQIEVGDQITMADSAIVRKSGDERTVGLKNGGKITLIIDANLWDLFGEDREFVFGIIDKLREYQQKISAGAKSQAGGAK